MGKTEDNYFQEMLICHVKIFLKNGIAKKKKKQAISVLHGISANVRLGPVPNIADGRGICKSRDKNIIGIL